MLDKRNNVAVSRRTRGSVGVQPVLSTRVDRMCIIRLQRTPSFIDGTCAMRVLAARVHLLYNICVRAFVKFLKGRYERSRLGFISHARTRSFTAFFTIRKVHNT